MDEKPPPKDNQDSPELRISRSWDLYSVVAGLQPLMAGNNNFRSLVVLGSRRRNRVLAANKKDK